MSKSRGRPIGSGGPAAVLSPAEIQTVIRCSLKSGRHSARDQLALLFTLELGLLPARVSTLTIQDVFDECGAVRLTLPTVNGRTTYLTPRLRLALATYWERLELWFDGTESPLLRSQKGGAFTPASLARLMTKIYREAAINGSSRSGRKTVLASIYKMRP